MQSMTTEAKKITEYIPGEGAECAAVDVATGQIVFWKIAGYLVQRDPKDVDREEEEQLAIDVVIDNEVKRFEYCIPEVVGKHALVGYMAMEGAPYSAHETGRLGASALKVCPSAKVETIERRARQLAASRKGA